MGATLSDRHETQTQRKILPKWREKGFFSQLMQVSPSPKSKCLLVPISATDLGFIFRPERLHNDTICQ